MPLSNLQRASTRISVAPPPDAVDAAPTKPAAPLSSHRSAPEIPTPVGSDGGLDRGAPSKAPAAGPNYHAGGYSGSASPSPGAPGVIPPSTPQDLGASFPRAPGSLPPPTAHPVLTTTSQGHISVPLSPARRRKLCVVGTRHAPQPAAALADAFRSMFARTARTLEQQQQQQEQQALAQQQERDLILPEEMPGMSLAEGLRPSVGHTPPQAPATTGHSAGSTGSGAADTATLYKHYRSAAAARPEAGAAGLVLWQDAPLLLSVVDANVGPSGTGMPLEALHVIGTGAFLFTFSVYDRDSFVTVQHLRQQVAAGLAPHAAMLVGVTHDGTARPPASSPPGAQGAVGVTSSTPVPVGRISPHPGIVAGPPAWAVPPERQVGTSEALRLAKQWGVQYAEYSVQQRAPEGLVQIIEALLSAAEPDPGLGSPPSICSTNTLTAPSEMDASLRAAPLPPSPQARAVQPGPGASAPPRRAQSGSNPPAGQRRPPQSTTGRGSKSAKPKRKDTDCVLM